MIRALVLAIGILLPVAGNAEGSVFPFETKYSAIKAYFNKMGRDEKEKHSTFEYLELRECEKDTRGTISIYNRPSIKCKSVDYTESNRLGIRTCINKELKYFVRFQDLPEIIHREHGTCGPYREVKETQSPTKSTNKNLMTDKGIMIGGGFLLYASGVGTVLAVSGLRKQRTDATKPQKNDGEVEE